MAQVELARVFKRMSDEDRRSFAVSLEDHLHGRYFERSATGKLLNSDFILAALLEWANDQTRGDR
jgi:hypothetical protein